ncbi:hypothetical protein ACERK3_10725 [Phycisphaerales bacterium AB-hyl4]|uniref:Uncharacterized protein n=1 Tax=Natronomicrosphaera hydrolytica TaxID=3242702 RepID=A0ABV4U598_9BACT
MNNLYLTLKLSIGLTMATGMWLDVTPSNAEVPDSSQYGPVYRYHAEGKKIIANGWDTPDTAFVRKQLHQMEHNPLDGTAIVIRGQTGTESLDETCNTRKIWQKWTWERDWFDQAREDLHAVEFDRFSDNFIRINVTPGNVEWFDDEGWHAVANNLALMAELAKDTGLTGFAFDPESYRQHQFRYSIDAAHSFAEYQEMARMRGRETMSAIAEHFPGITILGFRFLSYNMAALTATDPNVILEHDDYGLYPAFFNGMLDALPPDATLVEGVEDTYLTNSTQEFLRVYHDMRFEAMRLVAPENRKKYQNQVQVGAAIYLDAYINPTGERWRVNDFGQPPVERLRQNLTNALAIAEEYVWLWGERSHWFETSSTQWHAERQSGVSWQDALPGIEHAFAWARHPMRTAADAVGGLKEKGKLSNLARNSDFTQTGEDQPDVMASDWDSEGLPAHWSSWQRDYSHGTFKWDQSKGRTRAGSAKAVGVQHGAFIQVLDVKPGQQLIVEAHAQLQGEVTPFVRIQWRQHTGHRILAYYDITAQFDAVTQTDDDWQRAVTVLTVPDRAHEMAIILFATGRAGEENVTWFDDVHVYELTPTTLWE